MKADFEISITQAHSNISDKQPGKKDKMLNYSNTKNQALRIAVAFKPKKNVKYSSKFKIEVYDGLHLFFQLSGSGTNTPQKTLINY